MRLQHLIVGIVVAAAAGVPAVVLAQDRGMSTQQEQPRVEDTLSSQSGLSVNVERPTQPYRVLWPGHRILHGTVESVRGDLVKVNTGELVSRYLSSKEAVEKGLPRLNKGDRLELAVNDHNMVVDYHLAGKSTWHRIIRGQLAQPLPVGQEWAVIRTEDGSEEAFSVRPLARSKVSAIPIHAPAMFLTDESSKIIDATFGNESALQRQSVEWKKSPPKAPYDRIEGTLVRSPEWVVIKTADGKEQTYEVRPYLRDKLAKAEGQSVVVLLDDENKISDAVGTGM